MSSTSAETSVEMTNNSDEMQNDPKSFRDPGFEETIFWAAVVGLIGGLITTAYYYVLEACLRFVWNTVPDWLETLFEIKALSHLAQTHEELYSIFIEPYFPGGIPSSIYLWIVATIGGLCVGLALHFLGSPGEISTVVDNVHEPGQINPRQTPSMIAVSLFSITAGGSLGPEAPLVQFIGSFGSWLGTKLKLTSAKVRLLTLCGMGAALSAFFGAPVGGTIFALEIPHRRGLQFYEALVPAVTSGILCFSVFRAITGMSAAGLYHFPAVGSLKLEHLFESALFGVLGALAAYVFILLFKGVQYLSDRIAQHKILLATLGGFLIGAIAYIFPQTLYFSELEIQSIIVDTGAELGIKLLLAIALFKMLAISCTVHSGFRGGFIFPLFFVGAAIGLAISQAFPQIHPTIAMLCMMAAINVAVTKTPIATPLILSALTNSATVPVIIIASFVSFILTNRISVIRTQRPRELEKVRTSDFNSEQQLSTPQMAIEG